MINIDIALKLPLLPDTTKPLEVRKLAQVHRLTSQRPNFQLTCQIRHSSQQNTVLAPCKLQIIVTGQYLALAPMS